MLVRLAPVVLAACGRLGFDEATRDDAGSGEPAVEFRSLCATATLTVIENGNVIDDDVGRRLAAAVQMSCDVTLPTRTVSQDDPGILDSGTDRPLLAADELGVIGGGDGPNRAIAYLLRGDTKITWITAVNGDTTFRERTTNRLIVDGPTNAGRDFAFVQVIVEPISGARLLSAQGITTAGTSVAGAWFETMIAPMLAASTDAWTIVEWTDSDPIAGPSADDDLVIVESGR
jgi:hypothetical protein